MATIKTALKAIATGNSPLKALIGERFYAFNRVPQNSPLPYVTRQKVNLQRAQPMGTTSKQAKAQYELNCWAETEDGAEAVAAAVRSAFLRKASSTVDTIVIDCIMEENERDLMAEEESFARMNCTSLTFTIQYKEP